MDAVLYNKVTRLLITMVGLSLVTKVMGCPPEGIACPPEGIASVYISHVTKVSANRERV